MNLIDLLPKLENINTENRKNNKKMSTQKTEKLKGKSLGEILREEDTISWINKSRKIEKKQEQISKKKLIKRLNEQEKYTSTDLAGIKVKHTLNELEGAAENSVILTLKDNYILNETRNDLNEEEDELENIHLSEYFQRQERLKQKKKTKLGYDNLEAAEEEKKILYQYDDEDDKKERAKNKGFLLAGSSINIEEQKRVEKIKQNLARNIQIAEIGSLDLVKTEASDYYSKEELEILKPKKKTKKKIRKKDPSSVIEKLGNNIENINNNNNIENNNNNNNINKNEIDEMQIVGSEDRGSREQDNGIKKKKERQEEEEQRKQKNYEIALEKSAMTTKSKKVNPAIAVLQKLKRVQEEPSLKNNNSENYTIFKPSKIEPTDQNDEEDDSLLLTATSEFLRGINTNKQINLKKNQTKNEENEDEPIHVSEELEEKNFEKFGVSNVLNLLKERGEDPVDELWIGRRNDEKPKWYGTAEDPAPNINLSYTDDKGRKLTPKEAFRYQSRVFHGKNPSKRLQEKYRQRTEKDMELLKQRSSNALLSSHNALSEQQQRNQTPYADLSGSNSVSAQQAESFLKKDLPTNSQPSSSSSKNQPSPNPSNSSSNPNPSNASVISQGIQGSFKGFEIKTKKSKGK